MAHRLNILIPHLSQSHDAKSSQNRFYSPVCATKIIFFLVFPNVYSEKTTPSFKAFYLHSSQHYHNILKFNTLPSSYIHFIRHHPSLPVTIRHMNRKNSLHSKKEHIDLAKKLFNKVIKALSQGHSLTFIRQKSITNRTIAVTDGDG